MGVPVQWCPSWTSLNMSEEGWGLGPVRGDPVQEPPYEQTLRTETIIPSHYSLASVNDNKWVYQIYIFKKYAISCM